MKYEASLCSGCSSDVSSWGSGHRPEVGKSVCPGCAVLEQAREEKHPAGTKLYLIPAGVADEMDEDEELPPWLTDSSDELVED